VGSLPGTITQPRAYQAASGAAGAPRALTPSGCLCFYRPFTQVCSRARGLKGLVPRQPSKSSASGELVESAVGAAPALALAHTCLARVTATHLLLLPLCCCYRLLRLNEPACHGSLYRYTRCKEPTPPQILPTAVGRWHPAAL
jgi:hypothetical protein